MPNSFYRNCTSFQSSEQCLGVLAFINHDCIMTLPDLTHLNSHCLEIASTVPHLSLQGLPVFAAYPTSQASSKPSFGEDPRGSLWKPGCQPKGVGRANIPFLGVGGGCVFRQWARRCAPHAVSVGKESWGLDGTAHQCHGRPTLGCLEGCLPGVWTHSASPKSKPSV